MQPNRQQNYWQQPVGEENQELRPVEPLETLPTDQNLAAPLEQPMSPNPKPVNEPSANAVTWEAADYIHHEKTGSWFAAYALVVLALAAFVLFVLKDFVVLILLITMAIALFIFARRPARIVRYSLTPRGIHIGQEFHALTEYRSFGVIRDGDFYAIMLMPLKRFAPTTFVYFSTEVEGEQIVDLLGTVLPMESAKLDWIDVIIRKIRL